MRPSPPSDQPLRPALAVMCALLALAVAEATSSAAPDPRLGDAAPALSLPTLDGKRVELPRDRVVVVDFFATWCGPCHEALAAIDAAVRPLGPARVAVIVVDVGEAPEMVSAFLAAHPHALPAAATLVLDATGDTARRFGQHRFPTTFLVDAAGRIRHINRGYGSGYATRIATWLRAMAPPN